VILIFVLIGKWLVCILACRCPGGIRKNQQIFPFPVLLHACMHLISFVSSFIRSRIRASDNAIASRFTHQLLCSSSFWFNCTFLMQSNLHAKPAQSLARSKVIVSQNTFVKALVRNSPGPGTASFAAEQTFRTRRLFEHAVFLHGFHFVAGGVSEEVLEVLIFEGERVAGDAFLQSVSLGIVLGEMRVVENTYRGRDKVL
jgi:hypothetical protein